MRIGIRHLDSDDADHQERRSSWAEFWKLFTLMQFCDGFLASANTKPFVLGSKHATIASSRGAATEERTNGAWLDLVSPEFAELAATIVERGDLAPDDDIDFELEQDGKIVGMAEIAWPDVKFAIVLDDLPIGKWQRYGWTVVAMSDVLSSPYELAILLADLKKAKFENDGGEAE